MVQVLGRPALCSADNFTACADKFRQLSKEQLQIVITYMLTLCFSQMPNAVSLAQDIPANIDRDSFWMVLACILAQFGNLTGSAQEILAQAEAAKFHCIGPDQRMFLALEGICCILQNCVIIL